MRSGAKMRVGCIYRRSELHCDEVLNGTVDAVDASMQHARLYEEIGHQS